uniref:Adenylosuccinate lyase n=1 Tax=Ignisphaera aggregans TaxID=334771 RepID=A0A7C2ZUR8_9CREN
MSLPEHRTVDTINGSVCVLDWRYGSEEMRSLFKVESIVKRYIEVEKALMVGLARAGLAPEMCIEVLDKCSQGIKAEDVYAKEKELGHDIASLAYLLGERCGECGRYVHLGATSYDIVDTSWALAIRSALAIVMRRLRTVLEMLIDLSTRYADSIMVGRTHGQHALPITFGFKVANYVYELSRSYERLCECGKRIVKGKMSGAVGTMAAWGDRGFVVEKHAVEYLGLEPHAISTQVAPRDGFAELLSDLAILASQLDRFALEVRELSRPEIGEVYESAKRIGSSTMPHKRNPVIAERISGLAKILRGLVVSALENIPLMHERDLTNSSSERILIPHAFLIIDQMLIDMEKLLKTIHVDTEAMLRNIEKTRGALMAEAIMVKLVEKGMPRHVAHKKLQELAMDIREGETFLDKLLSDSEISKLLTEEELREALDYRRYLGQYRNLIERAISYARSAMGVCKPGATP